jgi:alpha,alpha-trehalase
MTQSYFDIDYQIANTHYGKLFHDVQFSNIFPDSKTFPDCIPIRKIEKIVDDYLKQKHEVDFDIKSFIISNFELPVVPTNGFKANLSDSLATHINNLWPFLTIQKSEYSGTYLPLPKPFIVPGGRFQELYYWDSFFTCLGLMESGKFEIVENIAENFAYLIDKYGFVPNGNRSYFLSRSQPPVFSLLIQMLAGNNNSKIFGQYLPQLLKEYDFWMNGNRAVKIDQNLSLNRYWDNLESPRPESYKEDIELAENSSQKPMALYRNIRAAAESGWDFSTRWFADGENFSTINTCNILPIDLNCLIYNLEITIQSAFKEIGNAKMEEKFKVKSELRKKNIQTLFWSNSFFYDIEVQNLKSTKFDSLAACFPLYFNIATIEQAEKVAHKLKKDFLKPGGLITTLCTSGQQWDAPNGWAPLQWIAYQGLVNYGFTALANEIRLNWLNKVETIYKKEGKLTEKYNVGNNTEAGGGGEYPNQDGFGWTNGVTMKFLSL